MLGWTSDDRQLITEMHSAQIEMGTNLKWVMKKLKEAESETGYKRCVAAKVAVTHCQADIDSMRKSFRWVRNVSVTGFIGIVTVGCAAAVNFVLGR